MIITVERESATIIEFNDDGISTKLCLCEPRSEFANAFPEINLAGVIQLSFEEESNIYAINSIDGVVSFSSPSEHPSLDFVSANAEAIKNWFVDTNNLRLRPSKYHQYNAQSHAWEISAVDAVSNARDNLRRQINTKRDELEASGFPYHGKTLDSDSRSVQRINTAVQAAQAAVEAGQPFQIEWTCADGSTLTLDAAGMLGMPVSLAMHANALHQHSRTLKAQVDAAETSADLSVIDITTGWPGQQGGV